MLQYFLKRLLLMIPTILGVAVVIFILMRMLPGDIVEVRLAGEGGFVQQETIDAERARLGLDKPLWRQFVDWMWGMVQLDFGNSARTNRASPGSCSRPASPSVRACTARRPGGDTGHRHAPPPHRPRRQHGARWRHVSAGPL